MVPHAGARQPRAAARPARPAGTCTLCSSDGTLRTMRTPRSEVQPAVGHRAHASGSGRVPVSRREPTFPHEASILRALALRHPCLALDVLIGTRALARAGSILNVTPAARAPACSRPAIRPEPSAASASGASPRTRTSGVAHMKRRLRTQCSSLAHPAHRSSSTHGAGRPSLQRSHESGHSSRMKAWLSWHCPPLIQCSQSTEASEHRPVTTISSPARTAWKMIRLEFSLMCVPADRCRDAQSTPPYSRLQPSP